MVSPDAPRLSGRSNPRSASDVDAWWTDSDTAVDSVRNYVQRDEADLVRLKETRRPELAALDIATDAATNHGCCGLALASKLGEAELWHARAEHGVEVNHVALIRRDIHAARGRRLPTGRSSLLAHRFLRCRLEMAARVGQFLADRTGHRLASSNRKLYSTA